MLLIPFTSAQSVYAYLIVFIITWGNMQKGVEADANITAAAGVAAAAEAAVASTPPTAIVEDESFITHPPPHFLSNGEISALFAKLQDLFPHLASKYSIGKTVKGREMYALALTARNKNDKNGNLLRPLVKVTANIHGDETLGRQMVIFLAQYLTTNYANLPEVQRLLNNTEIHLLPSCNPDGFTAAKALVSNKVMKIEEASTCQEDYCLSKDYTVFRKKDLNHNFASHIRLLPCFFRLLL